MKSPPAGDDGISRLIVPERFGKYPVTGLLGRGAMGAVYRAFDPDIRRTVAIKTIRWDLLSEAGPGGSLAGRFRNEARAAGRLSHPGIVAVYEFGQGDDCAYIAMEYVEGSNLREYFSRKTAFSEADVVSIMVQLLDALGHAHERKVWHRDIKPANLIIMKDGRLKIADFGIARIEASEITQTFPMMGTPGYIPPEVYRGESIDHRVDLFAAGAVMYQLLAGKAPFDGAPESVMYRVLNHDPASLHADEPGRRCAHYAPVVMKALAKAPAERFESASVFRDAILAAYSGPVNSAVSPDTVLIAPAAGPKRRSGDAGASAPSRPGYGSGRTPWPNGWNPATLGSVQTQLATVVGPMARVLVQRAAQRCADVDTLVNLIAGELETADERQAFLSGLSTGSFTPLPGHDHIPGVALRHAGFANSRIGDGQARLSSKEIERATAALARRIGPLARLMVKRAHDQTDDPEQFLLLLLEGIESQSDREAFLRDIRPH
ncbi:MAG TPA: serine/threonine-protein kinase [Burkholderiaceae bacterium]|nr:serine/threonine-protein kinase [Burkholderiaceae bacterium]